MSASLVGSEMCIRDRAWLGTKTTVTSSTAAPQVAAVEFPKVEPPAAVSYTHLTLPTICSV
eukprot:7522365-Alexandrium_andersonii.AAC.1